MAGFNKGFLPVHAREAGVVFLGGKVTLGASGVIASQSCKGFSVVKTAAEVGRYTATFDGSFPGFLSGTITLEGAADAAWTASKGIVGFFRNIPDSAVGTLDVQFTTAVATPADTELPDGTVFWLFFAMKNSLAW